MGPHEMSTINVKMMNHNGLYTKTSSENGDSYLLRDGLGLGSVGFGWVLTLQLG